MRPEMVDTAAVGTDDALLDALGGRAPESTPAGESTDEVTVVLLEFRRAVDARPVPALVSGRRARSVIRRARRVARISRLVNRLRRTR